MTHSDLVVKCRYEPATIEQIVKVRLLFLAIFHEIASDCAKLTLDDAPVSVGKYIAKQMQRPWPEQLHDLPRMTRSRYRQAIYTYLDIKAFRDGG